MKKRYRCVCLYSGTCKNTECPHSVPHAYWEEECHAYPLCTLDKDVSCNIIYTITDETNDETTYIDKHLETTV